ncbi:MAG: TonB-dependent receptor [Sphingomonadales bacterium]|nr:TonB-dependent receptor [Sphingomonadales bacterium]
MLGNMERDFPRRAAGLTRRASLAALAMSLGIAVPAFAQEAPQSGSAAEDQAIIITGSRLGRTTFDTPTPVTTLGADTIKQLAITNVGVGLSQLPAFRASVSPATQGFGSFNVGANIVNLRGIGPSRNLVLVDGRRFAPSTREGTVDLNLVPSIMVGRMEVVTGGASAAYGSDAIAGAVNVILDKSLEGLKGQLDYGVSGEGDGRNIHGALAFGTKFAGGRGHFVIGGEYDDQNGIGNCFTRDWCRPGAVVTNAGFNTPAGTGNGVPNLVRSNENAGWFFNTGGVVSSNNNTTPATAAIRGLRGTGGVTFGSDGSVLPFQVGSRAFALSQIGGDIYPTYTDANITVPVTRYSAFAHADYEFSDSLSGFIEGSYGHITGKLLQTAYFSASLPIFADNPYVPAAIRALPSVGPLPAIPAADRPANAAALFNMGRVFDDIGRGYSVSKADSYRFTTGLKGSIAGSWEWDAYYQYGRTDRLQTVERNLITGDPTLPLQGAANGTADTYAAANARFYYALDAVRDPATGNITCRALLSSSAALRQAAAGCVPINLFGAGNVDQRGKDYIFGTLREDIKLQQHVVALNLRGELAQLPAGPIAVAGGAEYRVDKIEVTHDALSNQYAYFQNFGSDYNGTSKVLEGYAEVGVPLVKDASWTKSLGIDGAVRVTRYDISGFGSYLRTNSKNEFTRTTWKLSGTWEPVDWLRIRATQSHDIRAPNFAELYLASAGAFTAITNRFTGTANTPALFSGGSPVLKPETADTTTAGIILQPGGAAQGLRLSVDYYRIRVKDYIGTAPAGAQQIVDRCYAGVQIACNLITFGPGQSITQIRNVSLNLDRLLAEGVDIEAQYRLSLGTDSALILRGLATHVRKLEATNFGQAINRAGQTGQQAAIAAPDWIVNGYVTYDGPLVTATVQGRYIPSGKFDAAYVGPGDPGYATTVPNSINNNNVGARFYVNLFGSVRLHGDKERGVELFGSINNLFDRAPPAAPETQFPTNPTYFDTIGRYFRAGVRFTF